MSTLVHLRLPCLLHLNILYVDTWANLCIFFLKFASANIFASVSCVFYPLNSLNHVRICASIPSIAPRDFQKQDHVIARFSFYFTKKIWTLYEVLRNPVNSRKSDYLHMVPYCLMESWVSKSPLMKSWVSKSPLMKSCMSFPARILSVLRFSRRLSDKGQRQQLYYIYMQK